MPLIILILYFKIRDKVAKRVGRILGFPKRLKSKEHGDNITWFLAKQNNCGMC